MVAVEIRIHVYLSLVRRRQVLKVYQLTSLPRPCIPENHSDYPPILIALLEIIPIYRQCDVTSPAAS